MKRKDYNFKGVPTRALWRELERRESLAYMRNVLKEIRLKSKKLMTERVP
jgi:hypothetical protein